MQNVSEYLDKTRSAAVKLFEGIESYHAQLKQSSTVFVTSHTTEEAFDAQYSAWQAANKPQILAGLEAQRRYIGEAFAQAVLSGSVLQLASKVVECYSKNTEIPAEWATHVRQGQKSVPFCIGRLVRGIPLGLIIYAGRNQHIHIEDEVLHQPSHEVFRRLSANHGYSGEKSEPFLDPAFDLGLRCMTSYAQNILTLIGWQDLVSYESDLREMLQTQDRCA